MPEKQGNISVNQELDIVYPQRVGGYIVTKTLWKRLRRTIGQIEISSRIFSNIGYVFLGIAGTALFTAINLPVDGTRYVVCLAVSISFLGVGIFLIVFDHRCKRPLETKTKQDAIDCLDEIEEAFPKQEK